MGPGRLIRGILKYLQLPVSPCVQAIRRPRCSSSNGVLEVVSHARNSGVTSGCSWVGAAAQGGSRHEAYEYVLTSIVRWHAGPAPRLHARRSSSNVSIEEADSSDE